MESHHFLLKSKYKFEIILIGDLKVGKTSLVKNFSVRIKQTEEFCINYHPTFEGHCYIKSFTIENSLIQLKVVYIIKNDLSWKPRLKAFIRRIINFLHAVIIIFDISKRETFTNLENWMGKIKSYVPVYVFRLLVGNKNDLESKREVSYEEGLMFANAYGMPYIEVSAKAGTNINECFLFTTLVLKQWN